MSEFKQLSLSQAAKFDQMNSLKNVHTGWRKVSDERRERGISRKARIQQKEKK